MPRGHKLEIGSSLEAMEEAGLITYNENDLPIYIPQSAHLTDLQVTRILIPYITQNINISDRQLSEFTGIRREIIRRVRRSESFNYHYIQALSQSLTQVSGAVIMKMLAMSNDPSVSAKLQIEASKVYLAYTSETNKLAEEMRKNRKDEDIAKITVDEILKLAEGMD